MSASGTKVRRVAASTAAALMMAALTFHSDEARSGTELPVNVPMPPPLIWQPCEFNAQRECATLKVPLNYANLSEGYIDLPVARRHGTEPARGPLLVNYGGPISAAADVIGSESEADLAYFLTAEVVEKYDLIGLNARGVTQGVTCFNPQQRQDYWLTNHFTRTNTELSNLLSLERAANQRCLADEPQISRHMSSAESIRDMESLRLALSVDRFSFLGLSYGTFIGNRYAALYPGRVKSMVLDAVVDHSINDSEIVNDLYRAHEASWTAFKQWCADTANTCRLRGQNLDTVFSQLLARARSQGIPAPYNPLQPGRPMNDWELAFVLEATTIAGILNPWTEEILFKATQNNDASLAAYIYDDATGLRGDGLYHGVDTFRALTCVDSRWSQLLPSPSAALAFTLSAKNISPRFGESSFVQAPQQCYGYPVPPMEAPPVNVKVAAGIAPALVIGGELDRSAPFKWAQSVASQIPNSRLIVRTGTGHVSIDKSRCIQRMVADYLVRNVVPANGTQCATDPDLWSEELMPVPHDFDPPSTPMLKGHRLNFPNMTPRSGAPRQ